MKKLYVLFLAQLIAVALIAQQKVGINNPTPGYALDVFDAANQGFFTNFVSNSQSYAIMQIQGNYTPAASNTAYIGMGLYRNGGGKGYLVLDGSNNLILSTNISAFPHLAITPAGNVGIGRTDAGFPISFANTLGDKIGLYGTSGNSYGFGVQTNLLQVHTDVSGSDIAFGYGSSAAMTERMRIKGNGYVGIGTNTPGARLQIVQTGLYTRTEGAGNALELWDTTGTDHLLYMGADATNQFGFIQSVASGGFRDLLLQGRGGSVIVGKDQGSVLSVRGDLVLDYGNSNTGSVTYAARFGSSSGEAIGSRRTGGGTNPFGLDFYTQSNRRMSVTNGGDVEVVNNLSVSGGKGIVRSNSSTQMKRVTVLTNATFTLAPGDTLGFGSGRLGFGETFSAPPTVTIAGINSIISGVANPAVQWVFYDITTSSCRGMVINPTKYTIAFAAYWNVEVIGPQ